jgi:cell division protein FtsZ
MQKKGVGIKEEKARRKICTITPNYSTVQSCETKYQSSVCSVWWVSLARPSNIYAETKKEVSTSKPAEEPVPSPTAKIEDEESINMQLVIRNDIPAADGAESPPSSTPLQPQADELREAGDVAEEQKRKAAERLQKLRNLSFNVNAADPIMSLNQCRPISAAIWNYSTTLLPLKISIAITQLKPDGNNSARISTINTFLDGKKPD